MSKAEPLKDFTTVAKLSPKLDLRTTKFTTNVAPLPGNLLAKSNSSQQEVSKQHKNGDSNSDSKNSCCDEGGGGGGRWDHSSGIGNGEKDFELGSRRPAKADFEDAINLTGYGKFHYILLAICGLVSTSEEMDVISMSFILPSAQCDLHLNTQTKGWLNSIIFIGMMTGAYVWGSIADTIGRKKVLIVISIMNAFCIVASSFSQSFAVFMVFRFLNGAA